jgi:enoyl-CoA hydratase
VKLGTIPGYGGTQRLPRIVGRGRALQLLLTGEIIDAQEAWRIGLVNRVVAGTELLTVTDQLLRQILANGPLAVAACIDLVNRGAHLSLKDALNEEADEFGRLASTADIAEGTAAFLEKRPPSFRGH